MKHNSTITALALIALSITPFALGMNPEGQPRAVSSLAAGSPAQAAASSSSISASSAVRSAHATTPIRYVPSLRAKAAQVVARMVSNEQVYPNETQLKTADRIAQRFALCTNTNATSAVMTMTEYIKSLNPYDACLAAIRFSDKRLFCEYLPLCSTKEIVEFKRPFDFISILKEYIKKDDINFLARLIGKINIETRYNGDATLLHWAAESGACKCIRLLVHLGANVNQLTVSGVTPLHYTFWEDNDTKPDNAVATLLELGADVNIPNGLNMITPLHEVALQNNLTIMQLLLSQNPLPLLDERDFEDLTPLERVLDHISSTGSSLWQFYTARTNFNLLLKAGANINAQNAKGQTALHRFIDENEKIQIEDPSYFAVQLLLDNGANVKLIDKDGRTATMIAQEKGFHTIASLLESKTKQSLSALEMESPSAKMRQSPAQQDRSEKEY